MSRLRQGRAAWWGLVALLTTCAVCGGGMYFLYNLARQAKSDIVRINHSDKDLQKAAEVARKELPQFVDRLKHPEAGDRFAIKGRFVTPVGPEYLWLKDPKIVNDEFVGTLDQKPVALEAKKGDKLKVKPADVYDFLIQRADGSQTGGFTEIELQRQR